MLSIRMFLNKYGFRCINELKLEAKTLHDDPGMYTMTQLCDDYMNVL